jgi:hypothetical protein
VAEVAGRRFGGVGEQAEAGFRQAGSGAAGRQAAQRW